MDCGKPKFPERPKWAAYSRPELRQAFKFLDDVGYDG